MELSDKQKAFWLNANKRWNIKTGATRSGKTYLDYYMIPRRIRACTNDGLILLLGNTKGTLERNILCPMRAIWGNLVGTIGSDNKVTLFGRQCYALGADKVNQVTKIQGAGFQYVYGDEITTWHQDVFQMLKSRLDKPNSCFDGTCNPDNPNHWLKAFLESSADIYQQAYIIDDNPFLSPLFVEALKREYAGTVYYDRFILGKWALAEGLVYPMFNKDKHVIRCLPWEGDKKEKPKYKDSGEYYVSVDYGTINPTSMGLWRIYDGVAYRVKEYYFDSRREKRQKTDEEYYQDLCEFVEGKEIAAIIIDPSAASFITLIRRHGRFSVRKANNDVLDGIRTTSTFLNAGQIKVHEACTDSIREYGAYRWDEKSTDDRVLKENDHAMDDTRYFVMTVLRRKLRGAFDV